MIKRLLYIAYQKLFPARQEVRRLEREVEALNNKIEYLKKHSDITKLLPATGKLRELQLENLKYVKEVINLLEKELDVHPFLEGGALLGFVRHNGYIPWDDDLDFGVKRDEFNKIIDYCKTNFFWADVHYIQENSYVEFNKILQEHPNEYVAILTPYCLHIYKGTDINNALNAEFFPWDYVKEDISTEQYVAFSKEYKAKLEELHTWTKIFAYIEDKNLYNSVYSENPTGFIAPGIGHWDLGKQTIRGYYQVKDIYPLQKETFEQTEVYVPANPDCYLKMAYGNYMDYPSDFGISHNLEEINTTVNNK